MAKLEVEAMLLGIWKNVEDMELSISLNELEMILDAAREKEYRQQKFAAALKGIDLDAQNQEDSREMFERARARANARLKGENPENADYDMLGLDIEVE